jgi:hypothetical protein
MTAIKELRSWKITAMEPASRVSAGLLIPPPSTVETSGLGEPFELGPLAGRELLIVLQVEDAIEQESLHVSIWGSEDGGQWGEKPLFWFPEVFNRGVKPAALNLAERPQIKFLQARWEVNRWGRGLPRAFFKFRVEVRELA